MATTTTNNAWPIPQSTDYVKDGATAMASLGSAIDTSTGTGLLAWTAWTPTTSNLTLGNGTMVARYAKLGKIVHFYFKFTLGTTSAVGTAPNLTLPVAKYSTQGLINYSVNYIRSGVDYPQIGELFTTAGTNTAELYAGVASTTYFAATPITATIPFTWANTHIIEISGTYEAA